MYFFEICHESGSAHTNVGFSQEGGGLNSKVSSNSDSTPRKESRERKQAAVLIRSQGKKWLFI